MKINSFIIILSHKSFLSHPSPVMLVIIEILMVSSISIFLCRQWIESEM